MKWRNWVFAGSVLLAGCSKAPQQATEEDIRFFASDAYVVIAGKTLTLPFIAATDYVAMKPSFSLHRDADRKAAKAKLDRFREAASRPSTAPHLDRLEVGLETYGWNDTDMSFRRICPRLDREWAKSLCDNPWAPLIQALPPSRFYLTDLRNHQPFDTYYTVGGEKRSDQLNAIPRVGRKASIACDKKRGYHGTRYCTAALRIDGDLAAVWDVWEGPDYAETAQSKAEREGRAITALVTYGLGAREDYEKIEKVACANRGPRAKDFPGRPQCGAKIEDEPAGTANAPQSR